MVVSVETAPKFRSGRPQALVEASLPIPLVSDFSFAIAPDGRRFLMIEDVVIPEQEKKPSEIIVVENWIEELRRK
jgi:hypothetical protein